MFSEPNMKQIHDQNLSFWSPQPFFIAGFFFPQQLFQLGWLYRLWKLNPEIPAERVELDTMVDFVPYYAVGNLCIASEFLSRTKLIICSHLYLAWMIFWNSSRLDISHIFVTINSAAQLYYITQRLEPLNTSSTSSLLTHIVAKTFAGIGVLDFLHNYSAAFRVGEAPSALIRVGTGVGFALASACSDWIFGGCLVYDLIALTVGQRTVNPSWGNQLGLYAAGSAAIVTVRNLLVK